MFDKWLKTVCFQEPTKEAHDLAKMAWNAAIKSASINTSIPIECSWCPKGHTSGSKCKKCSDRPT